MKNPGDFYRDSDGDIWFVTNEDKLVLLTNSCGSAVGIIYDGTNLGEDWVRVEPSSWDKVEPVYQFGDRVENTWSRNKGRYVTGQRDKHVVLWDGETSCSGGYCDVDIRPA